MSYTPDAVLAKLSALNESHDSIATAAQWIMFHRSVQTRPCLPGLCDMLITLLLQSTRR
jgi:hypothetical protein